MRVIITDDCGCDLREVRLVPGFGPVVEQPKPLPAPPPPNLFRKPLARFPLMATFTMTDTQQSTFTVSATDKRGNPVPLPAGAVSWLVDLASVLTLTPSADGSSCLVASVGPLGTATVSVKVTDTSGNTLAAGSIDVAVTAGSAQNINITPGPASEQP